MLNCYDYCIFLLKILGLPFTSSVEHREAVVAKLLLIGNGESQLGIDGAVGCGFYAHCCFLTTQTNDDAK